ncbi:transglycosylase domain-containing protein [Thalassococcus sp. CAU 1522]|uniref:Transglycosylase domain-containing protein n=1 Tax=Thalassococcus arenae TaxID=2851652 RepID=A0ABS6N4J7_9RHOB|nr:transglycosylase domain-containing protein [Thalassococcus arenae]MBV2358945.1 transglycosylase domain-containing protein [Thalassococcus arenae]
MSTSNRGRSRLVADRRYKKPTAAKTTGKPSRPRRKKAPRKTRGPLGWVLSLLLWPFRLLFRLALYGTAVATLVVAAAVFYVYGTLPDYSALLDGRARGSITLLDRHGDIFARRGDQFGGAVTTETVSPHLSNAIVATEDKRFWWHAGISPRGIASAIRINLREGRGPLSGHGGSTITQQTAKLLCLGVEYDPAQWDSEAAYISDCRRGSLARKGREAIFALAMEAKYSKAEILSIYLNRAYMGGGAYGAEAAAQRYFAVSAAELNPAQSAMIAGLLTAPSSLAPTSNLARSQDRAATVLRLMNEQGYLTDDEATYWQQNPATLSTRNSNPDGGYFADWVIRAIARAEDAADGDAGDNRSSFDNDILRALEEASRDQVLQTTLDPAIQRAAAEAVDQVFSTRIREGSKAEVAVVVMSADGAVRAMVGGRDTDASGVFNRATQAKRQTGSAFKPFVYATALELGYGPLDTVVDEPFCMTIPGSGRWCPENYTSDYKGRVSLTDALKDSLNIPAVKISESVGRDLVHRVSADFGIASDLADTPALALGASESTLLEMTGAYAGILNGGSSVTPYGVVGQDGSGIGERVISPQAAGELIWMMQQVIERGTGRRAALPDREAAGKTGTSQEAKDAWFIGFTADYVAGVWMGYDDNTPLTGVTGGGLPAEIWREVMTRVHADLPARPLPAIAPARAAPAPAPQPAPQAQTGQNRQERPQRERPRDPVQSLLEQVLREIIGGN